MCRQAFLIVASVSLTVTFGSVFATAQATFYVDDDNCPGPGTGTIGDPFCLIQTAIDAAENLDTIAVSAGTYVENINFNGKPVTVTGVDGPDVTTIDGNDLASVVIFNGGEGPDSILDGFTITNGYGSDPLGWPAGGGALIIDSSPVLVNCRFIGNNGRNAGGGVYHGGGSPVITNCVFEANDALWGGGMYTQGGESPTLTNCSFLGNMAGEGGGGLFTQLESDSTLINTVFAGNSAAYGGAVCVDRDSPTLINCTLHGNTVDGEGGGIRVGGVGANLTATNCVLWENAPNQIGVSDSASATISYSNVQGGWDGTGNVDADPVFTSTAGHQFQLMPGSPCIDAGMNSALLPAITTDLGGVARYIDDPFTADTGVGTPPIVDLGAYEYGDCNQNGVFDGTDIDLGTSLDCNANLVPDECDMAYALSADCNGNGLLDECDIDDGTSEDCNANGIPDECDLGDQTSLDCNANGVPDECDVAVGTSEDCNFDLIPDECQPDEDCNENGVRDICDIGAGTSNDCNQNLSPDECDIVDGTSGDCNDNLIPDDCDIATGTSQDCNTNLIPDECDIADGTSLDENLDSIPDECNVPPLPEDGLGLTCIDDGDCPNESVCRLGVCYVPKNRYISFVPVMMGPPVAFQITSPNCPGMIRWVGEPFLSFYGEGMAAYAEDMPYFSDAWPEVVHLGDEEIHPGVGYEIRATFDGTAFTEPLSLPTSRINTDIVGRFVEGLWQPPNRLVNLDDIHAWFQAFEMHSTAPPHVWVDLAEAVPDGCTCSDYHFLIIAFEDAPGYAFPSSCGCGSATDCTDHAFCNGVEICQDTGSALVCAPGSDPCPDQLCDEDANTCEPCLVDAECSDGLFCNGAERCTSGVCKRGYYPCGDQGCNEESDDCGPISGPTMSLIPINATGGNPDFDANRVSLEQGGAQITFEVHLSGWNPDLSGDPALRTYQATVDASGYLGANAAPPLPGVDLVPLDIGAAIDVAHPDFVFGDLNPPCVPIPVVSMATPDYKWGTTVLGGCSKADDGQTYYLGTLILDVPIEAAGTYTITLDAHNDFSFLNEPDGTRIPGLTTVPALVILPSDCNANGVPDADDIASGTSEDCNNNWSPDECDIALGVSTDCNANDLPDDCEPYEDCNTNGVRDICDIFGGTSGDCNGNWIPDDCESPDDCNENGMQDLCDLALFTSQDCNFNEVPDECDITDGTSLDDDVNGIPDECDAAPAPEPGGPSCHVAGDCAGAWAGAACVSGTCYVPKNRYVSMDPTTNADPVAYLVELVDSDHYPTAVGRSWWLDAPVCYDKDANPVPSAPPDSPCTDADKFGWVSQLTSTPVTRVWQETPLHVNGCGIVPVAVYDVRSTPDDGQTLSAPLRINTVDDPAGPSQSWGDLTGGPVPGVPGTWLPPEGAANMADVGNAVRTFEVRTEDTGYPPRVWVDLEANYTINFSDIQFLIMAFQGVDYADLDDLDSIGWHPADCP